MTPKTIERNEKGIAGERLGIDGGAKVIERNGARGGLSCARRVGR